MTKGRVESFSDGVFAIVLSILILALNVPDIPDHSSLSQYAVAVTPLVPQFIYFVLTFAMICIYWVSHHYLFSHIRSVNIELVWLNNLLLLGICILPFPTAMLGKNPTDQFPILLYGTHSLLLALVYYALRSYASHANLFIEEKESASALGPSHSIPAITLYVLSILLSFVNVYLSLACFFLVPLLYFMPNLIRFK